ncbi:MAG: amino acid permease [Desulfobacteraceae bacterium]|nr:amino acid permease [Desulfobacteraceae bacterium]MCB9494798.1 amino acid permease [Desulfobacteraceae bacterium]
MSGLKKELGLWDVWVISTGAIISSGIFILPGFAFAKSGPASIFAYILAAFFALTGLLSQAELTTAMPKAGGAYFYIKRTMGAAAGTVYGLIIFFALSLKSAFQLIGMAAFTNIFASFDIRIIAFCLIIFFTFVNIMGAKNAGKIQGVLILIVITGLIIFAFICFPQIKFARFDPFFTSSGASFIGTTAFVFISFGGLLKVASIGEEVKNPSRNLPLGMIMALFCVVFFYIVTLIIIFGLVDKNILVSSLTPIADAAGTSGIKYFSEFMAVIAILGFSATANTGIMGASRFPFALSRDKLVPPIFGYINLKLGTPVIGIIFTAVLMSGAILLEIDLLVKAASCILILTYIVTCLAVIILRESKIQNYKPDFKAPLYPWLQIIGITGLSVLLFSLGAIAFAITLGLMLLGFLIYFFYGRKNMDTDQDHALLHLIARITAKEFYSRNLETELKEIIYQRDSIVKDKFYGLAEEAEILDLEEEISHEDFFKMAANKMSYPLSITSEKIYNLLLEREASSSTIITPDVAIPHIIIEGENKFKLLIARSKKGIKFPFDDANVKAVFVLFGTRDQRNLHLKSLAAIAQIIRNKNFVNDWLAAKSTESLRDIVLLGERFHCKKEEI